ncbi:11655_t:CDS:2, partial [Funneliformis mosseae]
TTRGGKHRGGVSGRGTRGTMSTHGDGASPVISSTGARVRGASPSRSAVVARAAQTNRGKGRDPLYRTKDGGVEKTASKKRSEKKDTPPLPSISNVHWPGLSSDGEKKVYRVTLSNAVFMKLMTANAKGAHMKINISDKMEIATGETEKIQLDLSRCKKAEMAFYGNENSVGLVGKVVGYAKNTAESHIAVKKERVAKKILKASYEKESKEKRKIRVLDYGELPSEEVKAKSKRQKNNAGSSIKVQQAIPSPPTTFVHLSSNKSAPQPSNDTKAARGKAVRGKARSGRPRIISEVDDDDGIDASASSTSTRGSNATRGGKTTRGGKSTRGRGAKTIAFDAQKVNAPPAQSTASRAKRGRPAGVPNKSSRSTKTHTSTTKTSAAPKPAVPSTTFKHDNEQLSMSEGTNSSSSKKDKGISKKNGQSISSEWKPGQIINTFKEFKYARKRCEEMENDIQKVFEDLSGFENSYNSFINSIKKGSTQETLLREIEKQFGEGSTANKLMQKYSQLEKEIKTIHDELWRAARDGVYED